MGLGFPINGMPQCLHQSPHPGLHLPALTFIKKSFYKVWRGRGPSYVEQKEASIMSFLEWIVVGLIAGWLAGQVMKGSFSRSWASLLSVFCFLARLVLISAGSPIHTSKPSSASSRSNQREYPVALVR